MRLLILPALFLSAFLYAQTPDSLKQKKWAIGITYSPDFCYRIKYTSKMSNYYGEKEKPKTGITAGVSFLYKLMDRIGIETGFFYSTKGEKVYSHSSVSGNWITPDGTTTVLKPTESKTSYTYQYLEIPLKVNWYAVNGKFKLFPSLGISANVFLGKKTVTEFGVSEGGSDKNISYTYDAKNIPAADMAILVGVGLRYDVSKNIFIKVEPAYRQYIRALVDAPVSGYFYSFGMNTGIYFRL